MTLNQRIQHFYDESTPLWLDVWGEHMHHGYYGAAGTERKDHRQAQVNMVREVLKWGNIDAGYQMPDARYQMPDTKYQVPDTRYQILDVGCGVGGSSRLLSKLLDANVLGLTLSPVQAKNAEKYTQQAGLQKDVTFRVQDMMTLTPEADGKFDLIWSMESAEHIQDKKGLLEMFYKLLPSNGKFLIVTWCHRDTPPDLNIKEEQLLQNIGNLYHLPPWISISDYKKLAEEVGFVNVKTADWSEAVQPFWGAVIRSALSWNGLTGLLRSGWGTIKGAYAMQFMQAGFKKGVIKYGVIQGRKE